MARGRAFPPPPERLDVNLLRNRDGIIHLDAQIPNGALDFGVTEKQLNGPKISRAPVNQRCLRPAQRVRAIDMRVKPNAREPIA
jgi:hypothetical protein